MKLTLPPKVQRLIEEQVSSGKYETPEDVVAAGLASLEQQQRFADFAPGELDELLAVADEEIDRGELLDGEEAFVARRRRRSRGSKKAG